MGSFPQRRCLNIKQMERAKEKKKKVKTEDSEDEE